MGFTDRSIPDRDDADGYVCFANRLLPTTAHRNEGIYAVMACAEDVNPCSSKNSLHLNTLVQEYLEPRCIPTFKSGSFSVGHDNGCRNELQAVLEGMAHDGNAGLRKEVLRACKKARANFSGYSLPFATMSKHEQLQGYVLKDLRDTGYNAGVCRSRRSEPAAGDLSSQFFPEGYAYMDVLMVPPAGEGGVQATEEEKRVLIDLRFRSGFEIARPSPAYEDLLKVIPTCYVGSAQVLQQIIRILSAAMKRSLAGQGMPLPPWRALPFLESKWLSLRYSRSTQLLRLPSPPRPSSTCTPAPTRAAAENARDGTSNKPRHPLRDSCNLLLLLPAPADKPVLTDRNWVPPPVFMRAAKASTAHEKANHLPPQPWHLPVLPQRSQSLKKPRKRVGALTLELQNASIAGNARSIPTVGLHIRI